MKGAPPLTSGADYLHAIVEEAQRLDLRSLG
jgi:sRNA-binding protein